jgi:hypothetical protein
MRRLQIVHVLVFACAASCSSVRDQAVPACPYCGDPVTHRRPDGAAEPVPRWRLATWTPPAPTDVR